MIFLLFTTTKTALSVIAINSATIIEYHIPSIFANSKNTFVFTTEIWASLKTRLIKEKQIGAAAARKASEGVLSHSKGG